MKYLLLISFFTSSAYGFTYAQSNIACNDDPYYQILDFWIGDWKVLDKEGVQVGTNSIRKILDGCGVEEMWKSKNGAQGKSLFYVDNTTGKWKQIWLTENAKRPGGQKEKVLFFAQPGELLIFQGSYNYEKREVLDRTKLMRISENEVRQIIEVSFDGGQSWEESFTGQYIRI